MDGGQIGNMFAAGAVGAIIGPFVAGQLADRYFSTEKLLGFSHLIGAALIWQLATIESETGFLVFSLIYGLVYAPTLSLTNSLAFHHIPDRDRDFGKVRVWGTLGWIAVGLAMGHWLAFRHTPTGVEQAVVSAAQNAGKSDAFRLSAILGAAMGLFCFFLPKTPPSLSDGGARSNATMEAIQEARRQPLLTLFLLAVPVSCIHQFYFMHTEVFLGAKQLEAPGWSKSIFGEGGGGLMTVGQMSEILVLAAVPFFARSVSRKSLLSIGLIAYGVRMALFAYVDVIPLPTMAVLLSGIALHGLCFGCFIFVAFMVVDENTSPGVRASAQNLFNLVIIGVGVIVGSKIGGWVSDWAGGDWTRLFETPMWASLVCLVLLCLFYPKSAVAFEDK
jgi:nucleoside transporter